MRQFYCTCTSHYTELQHNQMHLHAFCIPEKAFILSFHFIFNINCLDLSKGVFQIPVVLPICNTIFKLKTKIMSKPRQVALPALLVGGQSEYFRPAYSQPGIFQVAPGKPLTESGGKKKKLLEKGVRRGKK